MRKGFHCQGLFREDEMAEFLVLEKLELTTKKMVRWEAMTEKVTSFGEAQGKEVAGLERRPNFYEGQQAAPRTAPKKNKSWRREGRGSGTESSGGMSSRSVSKPRGNIR